MSLPAFDPRDAVDWEETADIRKLLGRCQTCSANGASGMVELRKIVTAALSQDAPWVRHISLNGAVMADNLSCVRYLVDEIKVETLSAKINSYTPLQQSVIWGKLDIMVYLLSRGAEFILEDGSSVVDMGRLRQQRLLEALEGSGDGEEFEGFTITRSKIEPLVKVGAEMLSVLEGIESAGSYPGWAQANGCHPLVKRFSSGLNFSESLFQCVTLRALVIRGDASLHTAAKRAELAAEKAAADEKQAKEEQPLIEALMEEGFDRPKAKAIRDTFGLATMKALKAAGLSSDEIEARLEVFIRTGNMTEGERRRFTRFVRDLERPPAAAQPAPAASKSTAKSSAKSSAKSKANPAAKAALLAMAGAKGAGKGYATKDAAAKPKKKKAGPVDGVAVLFSPDLPDGAFMLITRFLFCN